MRTPLLVCCWLLCLKATDALTRQYCLAAVEEEWDYAPKGNIVNNNPAADIYIKQGVDRIGSKYTKVLFRQFTDTTFTTRIPPNPLLGYLGPVIRGEVGDTILIHFKNLAFSSGRNFTVHPHGVLYDKASEGALYIDGTSGADKLDDGVPAGQTYTYTWTIPESFAPTEGDDDCLAWPYHSHRNSERDVATGLVGMMFTCRRGILNNDGSRKDIDKELIIYMDEIAESNSYLFQLNLKRCGIPSLCASLYHKKDEDFLHSNNMFHINGFVYGNLPRFEVNVREKITIHLFSLFEDISNFYISGQTLKLRHHRKSSINYMVGSSLTTTMKAEYPGTFLMSTMITPRHRAGMDAYLHVLPPPVRTYCIAAEKGIWDYAPSGQNLFSGGSFSNPNTKGHEQMTRSGNRIGRKYIKALFVEYTDHTFTERKYKSDAERHLGYLGPVIRAEAGDTIKVIFKNLADRQYSILPHGVTFTQDNEGFKYKNPDTGEFSGKIADPGQTVTYTWQVPEDTTAPTEDDPPCIVHSYHSGVDMLKDLQSGLAGPLLICKRGQLRKLLPSEKEFFIFFLSNDENESWYLDENINRFALHPASVNKNDADFKDSNIMSGINGLMWGNLRGLIMQQGDKVTWYAFGLGTLKDLHVISFFGQIATYDGNHFETKTIMPGSGMTLTSNPQRPGRWAFLDPAHLDGGMATILNVFPTKGYRSNTSFRPTHTRLYYIAAVEVEWEYADVKVDPVEGESLMNETLDGYIFVKDTDTFIGSKYKKVVYRQFTDYTFSTEIPRGPEDEHLGVLGPFIRAEVGENILVVFKNLACRPYSIHPQGVFYQKHSEGADYKDGPFYSIDQRVAPGKVFVYSWEVPYKSGPGPNDPNCISWLYYSATDLTRDPQSGLIGPLITCRKGILDGQNRRKDINREFAVLFHIFDENKSWYIDSNIARYAPNRIDRNDKTFKESNEMYSINGKIYSNVKGLVMTEGDVVDWHMLGWGTYLDIHPIHFHAQTLILRTDKRHRIDVIELAPAISETLEMVTNNPGTWILHCHDANHIKNGLLGVYTIKPKQ